MSGSSPTSDTASVLITDHSTLYTYSATNGRLGVVSSQTIGSADTQDFIYGYETNSNLLKTTQSFTNNNFSSKSGTGIQQVTNTYQTNRDALLTKSNTRGNDDSIISSVNYTVNNIGQRTNATRSGVATNSTTRGYDALGQVSYTEGQLVCIGDGYADLYGEATGDIRVRAQVGVRWYYKLRGASKLDEKWLINIPDKSIIGGSGGEKMEKLVTIITW